MIEAFQKTSFQFHQILLDYQNDLLNEEQVIEKSRKLIKDVMMAYHIPMSQYNAGRVGALLQAFLWPQFPINQLTLNSFSKNGLGIFKDQNDDLDLTNALNSGIIIALIIPENSSLSEECEALYKYFSSHYSISKPNNN